MKACKKKELSWYKDKRIRLSDHDKNEILNVFKFKEMYRKGQLINTDKDDVNNANTKSDT